VRLLTAALLSKRCVIRDVVSWGRVLWRGRSYVGWGAQRRAPTYSNLPDCRRFGCPPTPPGTGPPGGFLNELSFQARR